MKFPSVDDLVSRNRAHAKDYEVVPTLQELGVAKAEIVLIISCADPRIFPEAIFHLKPGEAVVLRTVGGHPQPVINDIVALDNFGKISSVVLVHHTNCGATFFTDKLIKDKVKAQFPDASLETECFGEISTSLQDSLKKDLESLSDAPFLRKSLAASARGFIFDTKTGLLEEVKSRGCQ